MERANEDDDANGRERQFCVREGEYFSGGAIDLSPLNRRYHSLYCFTSNGDDGDGEKIESG